jgi:small-conductance mechanosensitive channel
MLATKVKHKPMTCIMSLLWWLCHMFMFYFGRQHIMALLWRLCHMLMFYFGSQHIMSLLWWLCHMFMFYFGRQHIMSLLWWLCHMFMRNCRKIILSEKVRTIVTNFYEKGYRYLHKAKFQQMYLMSLPHNHHSKDMSCLYYDDYVICLCFTLVANISCPYYDDYVICSCFTLVANISCLYYDDYVICLCLPK